MTFSIFVRQGGGFRDSLAEIADELCPPEERIPDILPYLIRTPNHKVRGDNTLLPDCIVLKYFSLELVVLPCVWIPTVITRDSDTKAIGKISLEKGKRDLELGTWGAGGVPLGKYRLGGVWGWVGEGGGTLKAMSEYRNHGLECFGVCNVGGLQVQIINRSRAVIQISRSNNGCKMELEATHQQFAKETRSSPFFV